MTEEKYGVELLESLSAAFGPPGCEENVADIIRTQISSYADELTTDFMGNITAKINGKSRRALMFSAHMDEVGFMITI